MLLIINFFITVTELFLLYAKLEENYGLARHAMAVCERAEKAVQESDRFEMYNIHIQKAAEIYGVTKTREIYETAIENLPDSQAREMCLRFVDELGSKCELEEITPIWSKQVTLILFFPQVVNGRLPVNHQIVYQLQDIFNLLPDVNANDFVEAMMVKTNDQMLAV